MLDRSLLEAVPIANVLSVVHHYPPHIGGMEVVAQKQAESLAKVGLGSHVVTSAFSPAQAGTTDEHDGVRVVRCQAWHPLEQRFGIPFPLLGVSLWRTLRKEVRHADVVHLHDVFYLTSWVAYFWARVYHRPYVVTQHVGFVAHPSPLVMAAQTVVYATIGRLIFHSARQIVVYNRNVQAFLQGQGVPDNRVLELSNGVDTELFTPGNAEDKVTLRRRYGLPEDRILALFVGRLVPKKGVDKVLAAQSPHYDLVLVGPGQLPGGDEEPRPGVHVLGSRTQHELAELYRACDLFVFPAVGEILTLVMQEAMASGLPVITTDDPAYGSYNLDPALLRFVPAMPASLRAALEDLASKPELRRAMADYSRHVATQRFDWSANFRRLLQVYTPLIEGA